MNDVEYCLYFAKAGTQERHHYHKGLEPKYVLRDAYDVLDDMREGVGHVHQLHSDWSTHLEVWEIHPGEHGFTIDPDGKEVYNPTAPDRLIARAPWTDRFLTVMVAGVMDDGVRAYLDDWDVLYAFSWEATKEELRLGKGEL